MATKAVSDKKKTRKTAAVIDPFESVVESAPAKAATPKPIVAKVRAAKRVAAAIKTTAFDAVAEPASPPAETPEAKAPPKPRKAKAATPKAATSPAKPARKAKPKGAKAKTAVALPEQEPQVELSPVFLKLADVELPKLERENRARLLMQSPTKLYFYWSIKGNPWQQLEKVFGDTLGSYTLVVKLTDLKTERENMHRAEAEGTWWFDVEPDGEYQAEVGFYAPNRPYFRIIHSNSITTPRRSPSPHPASDARWTVSANKFAEVLDVAGFARDAYDVAMAGDDVQASTDASKVAFSSLVGRSDVQLDGISAEDIRYALLALASGFTLDELSSRVSPGLFSILQENSASVSPASAQSALREHFDVDETEWTEEEFASAVFGASLMHFPKTIRGKKLTSRHSPRYNPVSSHSLR